ncbi:hypothetical protein GCM10009839_49880 [Catenulispora yoronensis]|uniref:Uncharacterized protein n=1 Tax=Catenulispora yoronensis TaxID=450799 RepID=A0ABP5G764_9ACTN
MSDDHKARVEDLNHRITLAAKSLITLYTMLPLPIQLSIGSQPEIAATDLIHAAEILRDMPGITETTARELRSATWHWVAAVYIVAWFQAIGEDGPGLCATYILIECGSSMKAVREDLTRAAPGAP